MLSYAHPAAVDDADEPHAQSSLLLHVHVRAGYNPSQPEIDGRYNVKTHTLLQTKV